ncbi:hypothetical protein A6J59_004140 [Pasteurella multocida]|nr:hypothetical protein A0R69_04135 [Pasteurella multocida subsp. multocida]PNM09889.1 hypothetical protein A6J59_004140 [Pasteurella multocida]
MENMWLKSVIAKGLAGLIVLRLPNQPSEDTIAKTAEIWVKTILHQKIFNGWNEQDDKWRIEEAFLTLYAECDRFPSPKMLLERLPKRRVLALPEPKITVLTAEERERNLAFCQQFRKMLGAARVRK